MTEINFFFDQTKKFLDEKLFFIDKENYEDVLLQVYYSLRILFHAQ